MKKIFGNRKYGTVLSCIVLLSCIAFCVITVKTGFLTGGLIFILCALLLLFTAAIFFISYNKKTVRNVISTILSVLLILTLVTSCYFILVTESTLKNITAPSEEYTEIGVFVRTEDSATVLSDVKDYDFGIISEIKRAETDFALGKISEELSKTVIPAEYPGIEELLDSVIETEENRVIVFDKSFLLMLEDIEEHEDDEEKIREIYSVRVYDTDTGSEESGSGTSSADPVKKSHGPDVFTLYISGIDCSGSVSRRSRSDVNIIATVNVKTGQVLLVSTPRDFYVPLSISKGAKDKLTNAGIYGVKVSADTLGMLYGEEIDYYFRVNFDGFKSIIDALGGVTVNSEVEFSTKRNHFVKGANELDAEQALDFARQRHAFASGDRQRGKNQMALIKAIIKKMQSSALLLNFGDFMSGLSSSFETNMPYDKMTELVRNQIKNKTEWNVVSCSADGRGTSAKPYSQSHFAYVMVPDESTVNYAKEQMQKVINGEIISQ